MYKFHRRDVKLDTLYIDCIAIPHLEIRQLSCAVCKEDNCWNMPVHESAELHVDHFYLINQYYYHVPTIHRHCRELFELTPDLYV